MAFAQVPLLPHSCWKYASIGCTLYHQTLEVLWTKHGVCILIRVMQQIRAAQDNTACILEHHSVQLPRPQHAVSDELIEQTQPSKDPQSTTVHLLT